MSGNYSAKTYKLHNDKSRTLPVRDFLPTPDIRQQVAPEQHDKKAEAKTKQYG